MDINQLYNEILDADIIAPNSKINDIVAAFDVLKTNNDNPDLLFKCAKIIAQHNFHGKSNEALEVILNLGASGFAPQSAPPINQEIATATAPE